MTYMETGELDQIVSANRSHAYGNGKRDGRAAERERVLAIVREVRGGSVGYECGIVAACDEIIRRVTEGEG